GRLVGRLDVRLLILSGLLVTAGSEWMMTGFSLQMDNHLVIWSGFLQGVGTGFAYVPLAAISFATLGAQFRDEGTSIFNLLRNVGSSIGISITQALQVRNTQIAHADLASHIVPYRELLHSLPSVDLSTTHGLAALNALINRQAAMISYIDDFKFLFVLTLIMIPLVVILRSGRTGAGAPIVAE
ncbi:MAG: EmrB/QacA family drug resistance transporter, partial [Steroidobacteraceae bacterium]